MSSYQYRKSHWGDKTISRPSNLHNEISYTAKMAYFYWIGAQFVVIIQTPGTQLHSRVHMSLVAPYRPNQFVDRVRCQMLLIILKCRIMFGLRPRLYGIFIHTYMHTAFALSDRYRPVASTVIIQKGETCNGATKRTLCLANQLIFYGSFICPQIYWSNWKCLTPILNTFSC